MANDDLNMLRKKSSRHVLVIEADMAEDDKRNVFSISNRLRLAGNELIAIMRDNMEQLVRTKRYRKLKALYGRACENNDNALKSHLSAQMDVMQAEYDVSWDYCRRAMIPIGKKYGLPSVFALTRAEDIWKGVEKVIYADGKMLRFSKRGELPILRAIHFQKRGDLPILRAKQIERIITVKNIDGRLVFSYSGMTFSPIITDQFEEDEVNAVLNYLAHGEDIDAKAVKLFKETGEIPDTSRPCYAALRSEVIRGRLRVFIHLTIGQRGSSTRMALPVISMVEALSAVTSAPRRSPTPLIRSADLRILPREEKRLPGVRGRRGFSSGSLTAQEGQ